jgi:hypothetical protein
MEEVTEKWGYVVGEKLIKSGYDESVCTVAGFTKSYVRASDGVLFDPNGFQQ